jgi:hypothetical protein
MREVSYATGQVHTDAATLSCAAATGRTSDAGGGPVIHGLARVTRRTTHLTELPRSRCLRPAPTLRHRSQASPGCSFAAPRATAPTGPDVPVDCEATTALSGRSSRRRALCPTAEFNPLAPEQVAAAGAMRCAPSGCYSAFVLRDERESAGDDASTPAEDAEPFTFPGGDGAPPGIPFACEPGNDRPRRRALGHGAGKHSKKSSAAARGCDRGHACAAGRIPHMTASRQCLFTGAAGRPSYSVERVVGAVR